MKLEDIKKLIEAASPSPWVAATMTVEMGREVFVGAPSFDTGVATPWHMATPQANANADFIAAARTAMPKLLAVAMAAEFVVKDGEEKIWMLRVALKDLEADA